MNAQEIRLELVAMLEPIVSDGWCVETSIRPTFTGPCVQIGHADAIRQESYRAMQADFTLTLWVNEGDSDQDIVEFYRMLHEPSGVRAVLLADKRIRRADIVDCGPRDWAAPTWLAGDIQITFQLVEPAG